MVECFDKVKELYVLELNSCKIVDKIYCNLNIKEVLNVFFDYIVDIS